MNRSYGGQVDTITDAASVRDGYALIERIGELDDFIDQGIIDGSSYATTTEEKNWKLAILS
ncbi:MAG: hypothetical protein KAK01_11530 [Candidatus Marinimicrobia bacterium]|nr:hypothetical protein [Candidatus Neomarinimicrobiota bacterium]